MNPSDPTLTVEQWEDDCAMVMERLSFYVGSEYRGSTLYMVLEDRGEGGSIATDTWYDLSECT